MGFELTSSPTFSLLPLLALYSSLLTLYYPFRITSLLFTLLLSSSCYVVTLFFTLLLSFLHCCCSLLCIVILLYTLLLTFSRYYSPYRDAAFFFALLKFLFHVASFSSLRCLAFSFILMFFSSIALIF